MEFQLSYFKSWKMILWKCCTQYASKFGKLSSGHSARKGQFSFQSQRKAMPKNAQTTAQLHSSHMLVKVKVKSLSRVRLFETPWTARGAHQAPPSMGFSRQEYWSELPFPSPVSGWEAAYQDSGLKVDFFPLPFSTWLLCFSLHFGKDCLSTYKCKQLCSKEPDLLEWEVKWVLGKITENKATRGDGIPVELFQILKGDAVKVLHSICQQMWKTQQWPQG